jgi:phosphatidylserine synthase
MSLGHVPFALGVVPAVVLVALGVWMLKRFVKLALLLFVAAGALVLYLRVRHGAS